MATPPHQGPPEPNPPPPAEGGRAPSMRLEAEAAQALTDLQMSAGSLAGLLAGSSSSSSHSSAGSEATATRAVPAAPDAPEPPTLAVLAPPTPPPQYHQQQQQQQQQPPPQQQHQGSLGLVSLGSLGFSNMSMSLIEDVTGEGAKDEGPQPPPSPLATDALPPVSGASAMLVASPTPSLSAMEPPHLAVGSSLSLSLGPPSISHQASLGLTDPALAALPAWQEGVPLDSPSLIFASMESSTHGGALPTPAPAPAAAAIARPPSPLGFTPILEPDTHFVQPPPPSPPIPPQAPAPSPAAPAAAGIEPPAGYVFMPIQPPAPAPTPATSSSTTTTGGGSTIPPPQPPIQGISRGFTPPFYATLSVSPPTPTPMTGAAAAAPPPAAAAATGAATPMAVVHPTPTPAAAPVPIPTVSSTGQVTAMLGHLDVSTPPAPAAAAATRMEAVAASAAAASGGTTTTTQRTAPRAFLAYWQPQQHSKLQVGASVGGGKQDSPSSQSAASSSTATSAGKEEKPTGTVRGNYRCGLCGGMKKNHQCPMLYDSVQKREAGTEIDLCLTRGREGLTTTGAPTPYGPPELPNVPVKFLTVRCRALQPPLPALAQAPPVPFPRPVAPVAHLSFVPAPAVGVGVGMEHDQAFAPMQVASPPPAPYVAAEAPGVGVPHPGFPSSSSSQPQT